MTTIKLAANYIDLTNPAYIGLNVGYGHLGLVMGSDLRPKFPPLHGEPLVLI